MRASWKLGIAIGLIGAFALGAFVATSAGSGSSGYSAAPQVAAKPAHVGVVSDLKAAKRTRGPAFKTFIAKSFRTVAGGSLTSPAAPTDGGVDTIRIKCPRTFPLPVSAGEFTSGPGLAIVNSSRVNPFGGATRAHSYYIAVQNFTNNTRKWKPEITCAKHIRGT